MFGTHNKHASVLQRLWVLLVLAGLSICTPSNAAEPSVMRFDRISAEEGLSQSSVMAIAQDPTGFLWFATESGLDRYDGFEFLNYGRERGNANALASDFARDLHFAADGRLWVATDGGGVSRWDPATDRFKTWRHNPNDDSSLSTDRIRRITTDASGNVWIGTRGEGVSRIDHATGEITHFLNDTDVDSPVNRDDVHALAVASDGVIWIGTEAGLSRYDAISGEFQHTPIMAGEEDDSTGARVRSLMSDSQGFLWVGTKDSGVYRVDPQTMAMEHFDSDTDKLGSDRVNVLYEDNDGRIWAGTNGGLSLWLPDQGQFMTFRNDPTDPSSLTGDTIFSIFQDRGGILWVGTLTGGISKWNPRSWSFGHARLESPDGSEVRSNNVTSFTEDLDGNIWVGTFGGGISVLAGNARVSSVVSTESREPLSDDRVMALTSDRRGNVWAGTMRGGLNRIDTRTGQIESFQADPDQPNGIAVNGIMALYEASNGDLWIGTFGGGISRYNPDSGRFTNYAHDPDNPNSFSNMRATSITESSDGTIWAGTDGGGLNWFDKSAGIWQSLRHQSDDPASLSANTVYTLHVDSRDRLWVGTREGLDLVSKSNDVANPWQVSSISDEKGQTMDAVFGIQSDRKGRLWLSTSHGLVTYDPASQRVRNFHRNHGLQDEEFNFGASFMNSDGMMFFGGSSGYNAFRPHELEINTTPPPLALTSVSIMNEPLESHLANRPLESLSLGFNDYVLTFTVAALDFAAPEKNNYAYRLVGLDENWVELGNERRITYTNLHGGDYTLQIKAANSDGIWNQTGISVPLTVAFPPWKTWWAYTLYVLAAGILILGLWRSQQKKLQRELEYSRRLEHEVHDRTKQLNDRNKDLKHANSQLLEASTTDPLTGLRNRRFLFDQIGKDVDLVLRHYRDGTETMSAAGNNDLLFLMVDLDNFKPVNDTRGHEAGDELLLQIRDVLLDVCRSSDNVIRWGGDEFLIVARETNRKYAATLAERIRSGLSQRLFPLGDGHTARITSSIGYASFPFLKDQPELLDWEEVLGIADAAMYEAKKKRNAWTGIEGLRWDGDADELRRAIKTNPGELAEDGCIRAIESVDDVAEASA